MTIAYRFVINTWRRLEARTEKLFTIDLLIQFLKRGAGTPAHQTKNETHTTRWRRGVVYQSLIANKAQEGEVGEVGEEEGEGEMEGGDGGGGDAGGGERARDSN